MEDSASKPLPRRQAIPRRDYDAGISRRNLLRNVILGGAGIAAATLGLEAVASKAAEEPKIDERVEAIHKGGVEFTDELHFRTAATIGADLVNKAHLVRVYGVDVGNNNSFTVENIPVVKGKNPDLTDKNREGEWFALRADYRDGVGFVHSGYIYASRSHLTAGVLNENPGGQDLKVANFSKDNFTFVMQDGKPFAEKIGIVSFPQKAA